MRIFITGATGLVGSAVVAELAGAGHQLVGLARSDAAAAALQAGGVLVHRGSLADLNSLQRAAINSDAVIHCAFEHDFSRFGESADTDRLAIEALGAALAGSRRPLLVSTGMPLNAPQYPVTEQMEIPANAPTPRVSEQTAWSLLARGVEINVIRLPQVHNIARHGLVTSLLAIARQQGVSAYIDAGANRWSAAHVTDVARVYRLALEHYQPAAIYHAVGEEGVSLKAIAETLSRGLQLPLRSITAAQADAHFGFFAKLVTRDLSASSRWTQQQLRWQAYGPTLLEDLAQSLPA